MGSSDCEKSTRRETPMNPQLVFEHAPLKLPILCRVYHRRDAMSKESMRRDAPWDPRGAP